MSSSLSKRWVCVCVVENLSRIFLSKRPHVLFWVIRVWVKGKKVTLKDLLGRMFHEYFTRRPYLRNTCEIL